MKYIYLLLLLAACGAGKPKEPETKPYFVYIESMVPTGYSYEKEIKMDSISAISDSAAYAIGARNYVATLRANRMVNKKGWKFDTKGFRVENEYGADIKKNLPESVLKRTEEYIVEKMRE